jgi:hypothetical protein
MINGFSTRIPRPINKEITFFQQIYRIMTTDCYFTTYTHRENSKWIIDLNIRAKQIKLEENISMNFMTLG